MIEQRRYARTRIDCPLSFVRKGQSEKLTGVGKDISIGGMFVETTTPAPFGAGVVVELQLPNTQNAMTLPAVVRWVRSDGMGLQFGLLGALETHAITELSRQT